LSPSLSSLPDVASPSSHLFIVDKQDSTKKARQRKILEPSILADADLK
jgi:hypothetical protein